MLIFFLFLFQLSIYIDVDILTSSESDCSHFESIAHFISVNFTNFKFAIVNVEQNGAKRHYRTFQLHGSFFLLLFPFHGITAIVQR